MSAPPPMVPLEWDSEHFGFPVARITTLRPTAEELDAALEACAARSIRCAYLLIDADAHRSLRHAEQRGFVLRDIRIELDRPIDANERQPMLPNGLRLAGAEDLHPLAKVTRERMTSSRFFADPGFPRERCRELYVAFLRRGLAADPQRTTLATADLTGFVVCHLDTTAATGAIDIIAVARAAGGAGVGLSLVRAANSVFAASGLERATVVTQAENVSAQRAYQAAGYRTSATKLWLHRWFA